jgi:hypothetical protein
MIKRASSTTSLMNCNIFAGIKSTATKTRKMTVDNIRRSQSLWNVQKVGSSSPAPSRSLSVVYTSNMNLSEVSKSPKSLVGRFRKRPKDKSLQGWCYSAGPCLSGDVDAVDSNGRSLLFYAARYGRCSGTAD